MCLCVKALKGTSFPNGQLRDTGTRNSRRRYCKTYVVVHARYERAQGIGVWTTDESYQALFDCDFIVGRKTSSRIASQT